VQACTQLSRPRKSNTCIQSFSATRKTVYVVRALGAGHVALYHQELVVSSMVQKIDRVFKGMDMDTVDVFVQVLTEIGDMMCYNSK
jgi:hypothetical protein